MCRKIYKTGKAFAFFVMKPVKICYRNSIMYCCPRAKAICGMSNLDLGLIDPSYMDAFSLLCSYGDHEDGHENVNI